MCDPRHGVRLNEPRNEVIVEVPMPTATHDQIVACGTTLTLVEGLAKEHSGGKPKAV